MPFTGIRQTLVRFEDRLKLRRRMLRRLGVRLPRHLTPQEQETVRETIIRCVNCDHTGACSAWLNREDAPAEPPAYCPNRDIFEAMMKADAR